MTSYYGQFDDTERHAVAARIWGHRLRAGQHWMEYMLEFLSVLAGFEYQFGQGLSGREDDPNYKIEYAIPKRLGLRRFVFYDGREKTPDPRDRRATDEMIDRLRSHLPTDTARADELLDQLRSLLRSFSAVEDNRSWYAKSLFPVHEQFLLWEALRKGSTKYEYRRDVSQFLPAELDQEIEFRARNFFARGGELYYLMISAGTEGNHERRLRIARNLRTLLQERNATLGKFAEIVNDAWETLLDTADRHFVEGKLGWLPDPECPLYRQLAEDLDTFLQNNLDSLECLELLAHLISFHVVCYIYHRAHPASHPEGHESGSCLDACRPQLLVDLLGDEDGGVLRERSASTLRRLEGWQQERANELVTEKIHKWAAALPDDETLLRELDQEASSYFRIGKTRAKGKYDTALREVGERYATGAINRATMLDEVSTGVFGALRTDFRDNFLAVHGKLGRAIGLVAPRKGPRPRFVLGDTLLKTLVLASVCPGEQISFGALLERWYARYGIIVGPGEAHDSRLAERLRINEEHYARNRDALLVRMQRAGLITQYSDATALVCRP